MDNIPIYNDGIKRIEISGDFQEVVETFYSPIIMITISKNDFNFLVNIALNILEEEQINISRPVVSSTMPLIEWGKSMEICEPYKVFMNAFNILGQHIDIFNNKDKIKTEVEHSIKTSKLYCHIFNYAIRNAAGFIYAEGEDENYLMFFSHIECLL